MENPSRTFVYDSLLQGSIRLLVIHPAASDTTINCTINHHVFTRRPKYDALSYVWGSNAIKYRISLNGAAFYIWENLYNALNHLRGEEDERILWADAICVNQTDEDEKSHQVQMMADIYRGAETVRCWLGRYYEPGDLQEEVMGKSSRPNSSEEHPMTLAFQLLQKFGTNLNYDVWNSGPTGTNPRTGYLKTEMDSLIRAIQWTFEDSKHIAAWREVIRLCQRQYWRRVWIVQEVCCAREQMIHCGASSVPMIAFTRAQTATDLYRATRPLGLERATRDILTDLNIRSYNMTTLSTWALGDRGQYNGPKGLRTLAGSVLLMLKMQQYYGATEPRDKVYALAGLLEPFSSSKLVVDYGKSINQVYGEAISLLLNKFGSEGMKIFCTMFRIPQNMRMKDLQSWCPDMSRVIAYETEKEYSRTKIFEEELPRQLFSWKQGRLFSAAGKTQPQLGFSGNSTIMNCHGLILDKIDLCTEELLFLENYKFWKLVRDIALDSKPPGVTADARLEECWQTLCTDRPWLDASKMVSDRSAKAPSSYGPVFEFLCDQSSERVVTGLREYPEELLPRLDSLSAEHRIDAAMSRKEMDSWFMSVIVPFRLAVASATAKRRFVVSTGTYFGLVPFNTKVGDVICILFGCPMPVIMRPVNDHFIFIGETYVHGWMDGEAITEYECGKLSKTIFEIW